MDSSIRLCADYEEGMAEFSDTVRAAQSTIYYSTFLCNPDHQLTGQPEGVTITTLFTDAANRGVQIFILFNPETRYGNLKPADFLAKFPAGVRLRAVHGSGKLHPISKLISKNEKYSNHHQKYMCVDGTRMLVTGCDIDPDRAGWLTLNPSGYYWHEFLMSVPCTPDMYSYVQRNFEAICDPPPPLTMGKSEHDLMVGMIRGAKHFIHLESQICSTADSTKNNIFGALAERLAQAHKNPSSDRFFCFMLTNLRQVDESKTVDWMMRQDVLWSRRYLRQACKALDTPWTFVLDRVFMGTLQVGDIHVKVHSNILIQDGRALLRTSSNLSDRSMSNRPCDTELGIVINNPHVVSQFQQKLFTRYLGGETPRSPWAFFKAVREQKSDTYLPKPIRLSVGGNGDKTRVPDKMVNLLMDAIHKPKVFGGKELIVWEVVEVKRKHKKNWYKQPAVVTLFIVVAILVAAVLLWWLHGTSEPAVLLENTVPIVSVGPPSCSTGTFNTPPVVAL